MGGDVTNFHSKAPVSYGRMAGVLALAQTAQTPQQFVSRIVDGLLLAGIETRPHHHAVFNAANRNKLTGKHHPKREGREVDARVREQAPRSISGASAASVCGDDTGADDMEVGGGQDALDVTSTDRDRKKQAWKADKRQRQRARNKERDMKIASVERELGEIVNPSQGDSNTKA